MKRKLSALLVATMVVGATPVFAEDLTTTEESFTTTVSMNIDEEGTVSDVYVQGKDSDTFNEHIKLYTDQYTLIWTLMLDPDPTTDQYHSFTITSSEENPGAAEFTLVNPNLIGYTVVEPGQTGEITISEEKKCIAQLGAKAISTAGTYVFEITLNYN